MAADSPRGSRLARIAGLALTGSGVAHFVSPTVFDPLTGQAFPKNTRRHTYTDGGVETALGLGLLIRPTRKLALGGLAAFVAYLGANVVRNNR